MENQNLTITFYYNKKEDGTVVATCDLREKLTGVGKTELEARQDWYANFTELHHRDESHYGVHDFGSYKVEVKKLTLTEVESVS